MSKCRDASWYIDLYAGVEDEEDDEEDEEVDLDKEDLANLLAEHVGISALGRMDMDGMPEALDALLARSMLNA